MCVYLNYFLLLLVLHSLMGQTWFVFYIFFFHSLSSLKESEEIIGAEIREATNTFNCVFGTESNREELCNNLFAEMNKVVGLTTRECDKVVPKLAQNEELMVIFFKVDEERKFGWVKTMLEDIA
ncbi:hypothetical protein Hdeb2414_s0002g00066911 [Helianthus debilis subsp. tardiflorus]